MLFNLTKQKGLAILKLTAAIIILLLPSAMGSLPTSSGIYFLFITFAALLCIRLEKTRKIIASADYIAYLSLFAYAILTSLWAANKEGHLLYTFAVVVVSLFHFLASDYFAESAQDNIKRRMMYLLCASGAICAVVNIFYWLFKIVPIAAKTPLKAGLGTNNFLAIFLYFAMLFSIQLLKGNSGKRKFLLLGAFCAMLFVFVLSKSIVGWLFAIIFTMAYLVRNKGEKAFMVASVIGAALFLLASAIMISFTGYPTAFPDVFGYAVRHPYGLGGGFWSAGEIFSEASYTATPHVGLLAYIFAASGILGVFSCALIMLRGLVLFFRLKNTTSYAGLLLCIATIILPFGANIAVVLFLVGLNAYNEQGAAMTYKFNIKEEFVKKVSYILLVVIILSLTLFSHSIIRLSAKNAYDKKDYTSSYALYKIAGNMNLADSESFMMAVSSLRKSGDIALQKENAVKMIDTAVSRDRNNLQIIKEKALLYDSCNELELSAQQYRDAVQRACDKDKYNLLLVKQLYKIVEKYPKGSPETKRAYEEILNISQSTVKLDYKKEINDIADKAFKFTKGEIISEG